MCQLIHPTKVRRFYRIKIDNETARVEKWDCGYKVEDSRRTAEDGKKLMVWLVKLGYRNW